LYTVFFNIDFFFIFDFEQSNFFFGLNLVVVVSGIFLLFSKNLSISFNN
jgi:hypothetical protein